MLSDSACAVSTVRKIHPHQDHRGRPTGGRRGDLLGRQGDDSRSPGRLETTGDRDAVPRLGTHQQPRHRCEDDPRLRTGIVCGHLGLACVLRNGEMEAQTRQTLRAAPDQHRLGAREGRGAIGRTAPGGRVGPRLGRGKRRVLLDQPMKPLAASASRRRRSRAHQHLRDDGVAVIFISHNLEHVFAVADRITVRCGKGSLAERRIASTLIGDQVGVVDHRFVRIQDTRAAVRIGVRLFHSIDPGSGRAGKGKRTHRASHDRVHPGRARASRAHVS